MRTTSMRTITLLVVMVLGRPFLANGEDWRSFRGAGGTGVATEKQAPAKWSAEDNIVWKTALPQPGNGSPIVVGDRVMVASAEDAEGKKRTLYCFHRRDGKLQWKQSVDCEVMPTHRTNPYCGSTPAASDDRVVVWHATAGLFCYDLDGKEIWNQQLGEFRHIWGYGTSPIIVGDRVIMHCGPGKSVSIRAFALKDGKPLWTHEEPIEGDGSRNAKGAYMGSWSTPVVRTLNGVQQAICTMPTRVISLSVGSGELLWHCDGLRGPKGDLAYSSPLVSDSLCIVRGGFNGPSFAVRLGGNGDITKDRLWRRERNPQNIGTGLLIDGYYYMANAGPGSIQCLKAETGEEIWKARGPANMWGSMILVGDTAYVTAQNGETLVFRPNPDQFDKVAVNPLGDRSNGTPALAHGQWFLRTEGFLWCIGEK